MEPITMLIGGLSIARNLAGVAADYMGQMDDYRAAVRRYNDEIQERRENYFFELAQYTERGREIDTETESAKLERKLELQREAARLQVATGEAGVAGNSVERLFISAEQAAGRDVGTIEYNRDIQKNQNYTQAVASWRRSRAPKFYGEKPDSKMAFLRASLGFAGGAMDGYNASQKIA